MLSQNLQPMSLIDSQSESLDLETKTRKPNNQIERAMKSLTNAILAIRLPFLRLGCQQLAWLGLEPAGRWLP